MYKKPHSRMKSGDKRAGVSNDKIADIEETKQTARETSKSSKKKQSIRLMNLNQKSVKLRSKSKTQMTSIDKTVDEIIAPKEAEENKPKHDKSKDKSVKKQSNDIVKEDKVQHHSKESTK